MMVFQDGINSWYVASKVGGYNKTVGCAPGSSLKPSLNIWCNWVNRRPQEIGEGKGQHTYVSALATLSTGLLQQKSQTYSYIEKCWGLWLYGHN